MDNTGDITLAQRYADADVYSVNGPRLPHCSTCLSALCPTWRNPTSTTEPNLILIIYCIRYELLELGKNRTRLYILKPSNVSFFFSFCISFRSGCIHPSGQLANQFWSVLIQNENGRIVKWDQGKNGLSLRQPNKRWATLNSNTVHLKTGYVYITCLKACLSVQFNRVKGNMLLEKSQGMNMCLQENVRLSRQKGNLQLLFLTHVALAFLQCQALSTLAKYADSSVLKTGAKLDTPGFGPISFYTSEASFISFYRRKSSSFFGALPPPHPTHTHSLKGFTF